VTLPVLIAVNVALVAFFVWVLRRPNLLGFAKGGTWYLTWLSIGVITLMDELTSVFYAPAEAHRFIGSQAIFFIAFTSLLMRVLSSRMVEIAHILELNGVRGGGVYSFSYFVLGPTVSFVAVASIMVDYILTACISTVSAVINGTYFVSLSPTVEYGMILGIIWGVAFLNILGIKENARVTFSIFVAAAFVFVNLILLGILHMDAEAPARMVASARDVIDHAERGSVAFIQVVTIGVASCVLAYSGIESVIQTAGLVEGWRDIRRA
jgi:amino acid transporter